MIVRGPEFWGLDLIVSMGVTYAIVMAVAVVVAALYRLLSRPAAPSPATEKARRSLSRGA